MRGSQHRVNQHPAEDRQGKTGQSTTPAPGPALSAPRWPRRPARFAGAQAVPPLKSTHSQMDAARACVVAEQDGQAHEHQHATHRGGKQRRNRGDADPARQCLRRRRPLQGRPALAQATRPSTARSVPIANARASSSRLRRTGLPAPPAGRGARRRQTASRRTRRAPIGGAALKTRVAARGMIRSTRAAEAAAAPLQRSRSLRGFPHRQVPEFGFKFATLSLEFS